MATVFDQKPTPRYLARAIRTDDGYETRRVGWMIAEGVTIHARGGWLDRVTAEFRKTHPDAEVVKAEGWAYDDAGQYPHNWPDRIALHHQKLLDAIPATVDEEPYVFEDLP